MSVPYTKPEKHEPRFFLLFGEEGVWQEVSAGSYTAAMVANGIKGITPQDFVVDTLRGTITTDGSRPKDAKKKVVADPMVRRTSEEPDSSYRLVFPAGSYSVANMDTDSAMVTVVLTPEQYQRLGKAQAPHAIEKLAAKLGSKADGAGLIKEMLFGGAAEALQQLAKDMRDDKPAKKPKRPSIQDLRDLLKG